MISQNFYKIFNLTEKKCIDALETDALNSIQGETKGLPLDFYSLAQLLKS